MYVIIYKYNFKIQFILLYDNSNLFFFLYIYIYYLNVENSKYIFIIMKNVIILFMF